MKRFIVLITVLVLLMIITGCTLVADIFVAPTEQPTSTPTSEPTAVPTATPTAQPTATPSPSPTVEPTPTLEPDIYGDRDSIVEIHDTQVPEELTISLLYDRYTTYNDYYVVLKNTKIYERPTTSSSSIKSISFGQRYKMTATVSCDDEDDETLWFRVHYIDSDDNERYGYVSDSKGDARTFQFESALASANSLKTGLEEGQNVYISNYNNRLGKPPKMPDGAIVDEFGFLRDQAAPAYEMASRNSYMRYLPDGTLGQITYVGYSFVELYVFELDISVWVEKKYLSTNDSEKDWELGDSAIDDLTQVIVVDRHNQNLITLSYENDEWNIVSMAFVSTGRESTYADPTPLGAYLVIESKPKFVYLEDGSTTNEIDGYAPYVVRF